MKILETGDKYHANKEAIGSSMLKKIASKSLLHALAEEREETPALILGSAIHTAILEPEKFSSEFSVAPKCDRRTKEGKEIFAAFEAASVGKTILTDDQNQQINGIREAVLSHEIVSMMLRGGEAEYSYYVKDEDTGLTLKCRPDYHNKGALIDLKTCQDASYEGFSKAIGNFGYHIQAAYYLDVFNKSQGTNYKEFFFIAVESKAPYAVAVYRLDENQIDYGRMAYKKALQKLADFKNSGNSIEDLKALRKYGYPLEIIDIQVPYWMLDKIETA